MDLVTPSYGLLFWTGLTFCLLLFVLAKFAWKPILKQVNERSKKIDDALKEAENAREEMKALHSENERILKEARAERDAILKEAKDAGTKMIEEAREKACSTFRNESTSSYVFCSNCRTTRERIAHL